jgi:hypothetical protein
VLSLTRCEVRLARQLPRYILQLGCYVNFQELINHRLILWSTVVNAIHVMLSTHNPVFADSRRLTAQLASLSFCDYSMARLSTCIGTRSSEIASALADPRRFMAQLESLSFRDYSMAITLCSQLASNLSCHLQTPGVSWRSLSSCRSATTPWPLVV